MLNVRIEVSGDKETIAKLKKLGTDLTDWKNELTQVGDYLKDFYSNAVFETEGGILGKRWQGLQSAYDIWKRSAFPGRGTLQRTGALRKGFHSNASSTEVVVSNSVPYAKFHQFGTRRMPARVIIDIDRGRKEKIIDIFKAGLVQKIARAIK